MKKSARVKYTMMDVDRFGNVRWYFRKGSFKRRLPSPERGGAFDIAYKEALADESAGLPADKPNFPPANKRQKDGFVYFLKSGEAFKIGFSQAPLNRIGQLRTALAGKIDLLLVVPGSPTAEKAMHEKFSRNRLNGEWFRCGPNFDFELSKIFAEKLK